MSVAEALNWVKEQLPLTAVVGGLWVAYIYLRDKRQAEIARSIEARAPFLARQLELYFEAASVAGRLATITARSGAEWQKERARFDELFWTELSLVEDENVKDAMEKFKRGLIALSTVEEKEKGEDRAELIGEKESELRLLARNLALRLRESLQSSWVVDSGVTPKKLPSKNSG
jgi:hypothetical protein